MKKLFVILLAVFALVTLNSSIPFAEEKKKGGKRVFKIKDAIKVEGRLQKPEAFYILPKSSLKYEGLELKKSFLPKILKTVEQNPF